MTALDRIAYHVGRRDDVPNQELARSLAATSDSEGVAEIAAHLSDPNSSIASDCLKVLYETGYLSPELIAGYAEDFLRLLSSKNNRMRWGGMIALSTIASLQPDTIFEARELITQSMERGSVITVDAGVKTLARLAATSDERRQELLPMLIGRLGACRPSDVAGYAESIAVGIDSLWLDRFTTALESRLPELSTAQATRVQRAIRSVRRRFDAK